MSDLNIDNEAIEDVSQIDIFIWQRRWKTGNPIKIMQKALGPDEFVGEYLSDP